MMNSWLGSKSYARLILFVLLGFLALALPLRAQKQDLALSLGGFVGQTRGFNSPTTGQVNISADKNFGVNYGYRFLHSNAVGLFGELEFVAIPNQRLTTANAIVAQNYASLYVVPGVRVKFFPEARLSPWGALGGGYALYEESVRLSNGQPTTNRFLNRGVFDFGGGLDFRIFRFIGIRAEVRDFYSGNPKVNVGLNSSTQHNVVSSGGIVFHF
jgi:Outer membrane protein beta-barrel domain